MYVMPLNCTLKCGKFYVMYVFLTPPPQKKRECAAVREKRACLEKRSHTVRRSIGNLGQMLPIMVNAINQKTNSLCTECGKNVKTCISVFNHILYTVIATPSRSYSCVKNTVLIIYK